MNPTEDGMLTSTASTMEHEQQQHDSACDCMSALQLTRSAIARWRGSAPAETLPAGHRRISPQARHLARAQRGLAQWLAMGGFTQENRNAK